MSIRSAVDDESINFVSTRWTLRILNEWYAFFDGWSFTYYLSPAYISLSDVSMVFVTSKKGRGVRWGRKWSFNRDDGRKRKTRRVGQAGIKRSQLTNTCLQLWDRERERLVYLKSIYRPCVSEKMNWVKKKKENNFSFNFFYWNFNRVKWAFKTERQIVTCIRISLG